MKRFLTAAVLFVGCCFPLAQCGDKDDDSYKFVVVAYKGMCSGYYILNDDDTVYFDVATATGSGSYYSYSKSLESPTSITICVNAEEIVYASGSTAGECPSSVTVYIYANDKIVKQQVFSRQSTSTYDNNTQQYTYTYSIDGSLSYEFADDDSDKSVMSASSSD